MIALTVGTFRWWIAPLAYLGSMVVLVGASLVGLPPEFGQGAIFVGYILLASLIALACAGQTGGHALGLLGTRPWRTVALLSLLGAAVVLTLSEVAAHFDPQIAHSTAKVLSSIGFGTDTANDLIIVATICCLAPLGEEALYRGLIFRSLFNGLHKVIGKTGAVWAAASLAALLFAFSHGGEGQEASVIAVLFLSGLIYGLFYALTGSLWTAVLAHSVNNAVSMAAVVYPSDSAEISIKALILASPVITATLLWLWGRFWPR